MHKQHNYLQEILVPPFLHLYKVHISLLKASEVGSFHLICSHWCQIVLKGTKKNEKILICKKNGLYVIC